MEQRRIYPLPPGPELMEIIPDMASDWLETRRFDGNRKPSKVRIERLAADMKGGLWQETHQGIAFDTEGDHIPLPYGITWGGVPLTRRSDAA